MTKIDFPRKPVAFLVYFLKSLSAWQKTSFFLLMLCTASSTISHFYLLYGFKLLIDTLQTMTPDADVRQALFFPLAVIIANCAFHIIVYRLRDWIDMTSTPYVQNRLREMLMDNLTRHSHDYFHNRFSGELVTKVTNIITTYRVLLWERLLNGFLPTGIAVVSSGVILWSIEPMLTVFLGAAVILIGVVVYTVGDGMRKASKTLADRDADIAGQMVDTVTNIASVKNYANREHELGLLRAVQNPYIGAYRRFMMFQIGFWGLFDILITGMIIGMVLYLVSNWSKGIFSPGDVAVAMMIAWDMWYRLSYLSWHMGQVSADFGKMESALNDFVRPVGVEDKKDAPDFMPRDGTIEVKDVVFTYESGHRVFSGFNLTIPHAQKIGIVGLSGAGKTTLCQLLLRNYDADSGTILIGGEDITTVRQDSLRRKIAVIPQDPSLFHRSLRENIRYGRPEATEDDVLTAAQAAQAHDFILATPEGYDTPVGERGVKLSGGQRQRIAIARAMVKDAPILILDEATSALDSDTERAIQQALAKAMEGRTTIVIAHRLSTLAHLDRIIVMKDGTVVEDGNLQTLIAAGGHFAHLWSLQAGGFLPE